MQVPNRLWRGVIRFDGADDEEALAANLHMLRADLSLTDTEGALLTFVSSIYDRSQVVPSYELLTRHCQDLTEAGDGTGPAGMARLEMILASAEPLLTGADFRYELDQYRQAVLKSGIAQMLSEASAILTTGLSRMGPGPDGRWSQQMLVGPETAIDYVNQSLNKITSRFKRTSIEGSFRSEGDQVIRLYEKWKADPQGHLGVLCGVEKIDTAHRGLKPGDLALVMGFVSHMKSTFTLNWLYRAAVYQQKNVAIASLEMSIEMLRVLIYVMHARHPKFKGHPCQRRIDYDKVRTGALSADEEKFFRRVCDDLSNCMDYGEVYYKEPQNESVTVADIQRWAEAKDRIKPLDLLVIDYLGLLDPETNMSGMEQGSNLNRVIRQAKLCATNFGGGRGIPVLSPFQANRQGLQDAEKNGGRYKLTALSLANEAERSSDYVYYVYLDDQLRSQQSLRFGNLKARNAPVLTEPLTLFADPGTRIISDPDLSSAEQAPIDL